MPLPLDEYDLEDRFSAGLSLFSEAMDGGPIDPAEESLEHWHESVIIDAIIQSLARWMGDKPRLWF